MAFVLGLDCGTSVVKAAAFDADGREAGVGQATIEGVSPQPGWMEYRPEELWRAAAAAVRALDVPAAEIAAVGPTGAGNGVLLLDADGAPVRNGIFALDNRTAGMMAADEAAGLLDRMREVNGYSTWTGLTLYLLKWLRQHEPAALERAARIFVIKDYVKYRLTGRHVGDASEQSKLGLLDVRQGRCTRELLALYRLESLLDRFPPLEPSAAVIGAVTPAAAEATGLREGTPVVNGLADIDASALGAGTTRPGQLSIVAGTWSINQLFLDRPVIDARLFGLSRYAIDGVWEQLEASASSTANLSWFMKHICPELDYAQVDALVASVPPATTEVFFHPYLYGSNAKANARAGFYGLAGWQSRADLLAALFEGVVFSHNHHVEKLRGLGQAVSEGRLSGGAAHSARWSQMFADVLGLPVAVPDAQESGALGAAMCAAVGVGWHADLAAAAARMVRTARTHRPDPVLHARYAARYARYEHVTELMAPVWDELGKEI
jgi:L-xylulokinase